MTDTEKRLGAIAASAKMVLEGKQDIARYSIARVQNMFEYADTYDSAMLLWICRDELIHRGLEVADVASCSCEHASHFDGTGHVYGRSRISDGRSAKYVGPVCVRCADGHYAQFIDPNSKKG